MISIRPINRSIDWHLRNSSPVGPLKVAWISIVSKRIARYWGRACAMRHPKRALQRQFWWDGVCSQRNTRTCSSTPNSTEPKVAKQTLKWTNCVVLYLLYGRSRRVQRIEKRRKSRQRPKPIHLTPTMRTTRRESPRERTSLMTNVIQQVEHNVFVLYLFSKQLN